MRGRSPGGNPRIMLKRWRGRPKKANFVGQESLDAAAESNEDGVELEKFLSLFQYLTCPGLHHELAQGTLDTDPKRGRESDMDDVATKIIEILRKNMKDPSKAVTLDMPLSDLEIESLDLAVIVFDIEDTFGIEIPYNANEEVEAFATVGSVVDRVKSIIAETKASGAAA